jgi:hypothetical protein
MPAAAEAIFQFGGFILRDARLRGLLRMRSKPLSLRMKSKIFRMKSKPLILWMKS